MESALMAFMLIIVILLTVLLTVLLVRFFVTWWSFPFTTKDQLAAIQSQTKRTNEILENLSTNIYAITMHLEQFSKTHEQTPRSPVRLDSGGQ